MRNNNFWRICGGVNRGYVAIEKGANMNFWRICGGVNRKYVAIEKGANMNFEEVFGRICGGVKGYRRSFA